MQIHQVVTATKLIDLRYVQATALRGELNSQRIVVAEIETAGVGGIQRSFATRINPVFTNQTALCDIDGTGTVIEQAIRNIGPIDLQREFRQLDSHDITTEPVEPEQEFRGPDFDQPGRVVLLWTDDIDRNFLACDERVIGYIRHCGLTDFCSDRGEVAGRIDQQRISRSCDLRVAVRGNIIFVPRKDQQISRCGQADQQHNALYFSR